MLILCPSVFKIETRCAMHDCSIILDYNTSASAVDADMCSEAVSSKIDLAKQLATVLQGSVKPSKSSPPLCFSSFTQLMFLGVQ